MPSSARKSSLPAETTDTPATPTPALAERHNKLDAEAEAWVSSTLQGMTLDEKLGQLLMIECYGGFASVEDPELHRLLHEVERNHAGGLMIGTRAGPLGIARSRAYPTAAIANLLQGRAKIPLLVAADFERGTAMRLDEGTSFPHAMALAATRSTADAYTMGRITAAEARALGVHWIFAPVADVNSDPENPIINMRSFGEDAERVAAFVTAYVRGVEDHAALATAKHFPGHGATKTDSHLDLPTVPSDREHLKRVELQPFRAAIAAGVSAMMTGHIAVPALDPNPEVPATLSSAIVTDLLRCEMGFGGIVVTDALNMGGVTVRYAPAEAAVRSIAAGSDVLLLPPSPDAALRGLREGVRDGRLAISRIDEAVTHILRAKARLGLHESCKVSLDRLAEVVGRPQFRDAAEDIADRGITLLRDIPKLLPLDARRKTRALLIVIAGDADAYPGQDFEREVRWRVDSLQTLRCDTKFSTLESLELPPESYDVTILALLIRVADRKGSVGLPSDQAEMVHRILAMAKSDKPVIVACFGSPYVMERFPEAKTWLAAFSTADVAQRALGRALFGQISIGGRIPVHVPNAAAKNSGLDVAANPMTLARVNPAERGEFGSVYSLLDRAVADNAFPGGVLGIGYRGALRLHAFGAQTYGAGAIAVATDTIYDAASLTKAVVTTTAAEMLLEAGRLELDAPIARYIPEWGASSHDAARLSVTVRHLLTHTSGLPAHENYFEKLDTRREIVAAALGERLVREPGTEAIYSDVGFIIAGEIVERLTGQDLDDFANEHIFAPLEMSDTMFNPLPSLRARIAPTEHNSTFRAGLVHGEVHDENALAMGGVAGHAGMFSTAGDLAAFCQMLLNGGLYAHKRLLRRATIAEFTSPSAISGNTRALGWTVPTRESTSGRYFSARSFGHLGFTGTSMWIDPLRELFVVLLTNRVHPTRQNDKIKQVRPALHDAIVEALGLVTANEEAPRGSR